MKKLKTNRGITLIALIITIIVMLILVAVTVSVALNGGLFTTAKDAANKTQLEIDRETLQVGIIGALNGELKIATSNDLISNLPLGWDVTGTDGGPYIATSPKGNKFKVAIDGTIEPIVVRNSTELERYIFGSEGIGRDFTEIFDIEDTMTFKDDLTTTDFDETTLDIEFFNMALGDMTDTKVVYIFYMKYEGKLYKFEVDVGVDIETEAETWTTNPTDGIKLIYESEEETMVGKYVQYDGKKWIVLYDDNTNGLQMISADVLEISNVYLGRTDTGIDESKVEDFDGTKGISYFEKAVYSYNHAIETLNKKCSNLVTQKEGVTKGVRSVGSNPTVPSSENKDLYSSNNLATWANGIGNNRGYSTDYNYISDFERMMALGISKASNEEAYWLASRFVLNGLDEVRFNVHHIESKGSISIANSVWYVDSSDDTYAGDVCYGGVRPVISLESGILDGLTGEGTADSPYILQ